MCETSQYVIGLCSQVPVGGEEQAMVKLPERRLGACPTMGRMRAEQVTAAITFHGEGPVWWPRTNSLVFVDMLAGDIMTLTPSGTVARVATGSPVAACIRPREHHGAILAGERTFYTCADDSFEYFEPVTDPVVPEGFRFNDGACDSHGNFWCGTMAYDRTPAAASMYRLNATDSSVDTVFGDVTISNGLAWNTPGTQAYYIDTPQRTIERTDPTLTHREPLVQFTADQGWPDGLCLDAEDGLWVALNGGNAVHRYDAHGALTDVITVEASGVTACTFGGHDLSTLYITTSRENLDPHQEPSAGAVFACTPGVAGQPLAPYRA